MTNRQPLKPEAVKFLLSLAKCEEWHIFNGGKHAALASSLAREGLIKQVHYYRRATGGCSVYHLTTSGMCAATEALLDAKRIRLERTTGLQHRANMNSAFSGT